MKILMHPVVYSDLLQTCTAKEMDKLKIGKVFKEGMDATLELAGKDRDLRVTTEHPDKTRVDISCTVEELREMLNSKFEGIPPKEPELPPHPVRSMMAECFKAVVNQQVPVEGIRVPRWLFIKIARHMGDLDKKYVDADATWFVFLGMRVEIHDAPYISALGQDGQRVREVVRFEINKETLEVKEIPIQ